MSYTRLFVLSIAGFDPSGGAGVLADVKTFELHQCVGLAVSTANTIQTEHKFFSTVWQSIEQIKAQAEPLLAAYPVDTIKIGIVESLEVLQELIQWLKHKNNKVRIIWDPVIASSTGHSFITSINKAKLQELLNDIYLITPNIQEAKLLAGMDDEHNASEWLSHYTSVLLKGGHATEQGTDYLYTAGQYIQLMPNANHYSPKHGSGCILSSAIAANLAKGYDTVQACIRAKEYIESILNSNTNLLAYHYV